MKASLPVAGVEESGPALKVRLKVPRLTRPQEVKLSLADTPGEVTLKLAPRVDGIRISPEDPAARLGGGKIPLVPLQFEARAISFGADGKPNTDDDLTLGLIQPTWSLEDYAGTDMADDPAHIGKLDGSGLFTPASLAPAPERVRRNNTGDAWVVARYRPAGAPKTYRARVLLKVVVPEYRGNV